MTAIVLQAPHEFADAAYPAGTVAEVASEEETAREALRLRAAMLRQDGLVLVRLGGKLRWIEAR